MPCASSVGCSTGRLAGFVAALRRKCQRKFFEINRFTIAVDEALQALEQLSNKGRLRVTPELRARAIASC